MTIPNSLQDVFHPVLKALHMNTHERLLRRRHIQKLVQCYANEDESQLDNIDHNFFSRDVYAVEFQDCGFLRLPFDSNSRPIFNSKFASIVGLEISDLEQSMQNPEAVIPFHSIDFMCMTVHDIERFTDDQTLRYTRVLSGCRSRAILVSILTKKDYSPSGDVKGVRDCLLLHTDLFSA